MKSITETIGGAQGLLDISFDLQEVFEEYLTNENKTFLHMIRLIEEVQPKYRRTYAGIGRRPYPNEPFLRSIYAMRYFRMDMVKSLIERLKNDPNLRLICGFRKVPGKATFSRKFAELSNTSILKITITELAMKEYREKLVRYVSRDSTAIEAREKPVKQIAQKKPKMGRGRPKKGEIRKILPLKMIEGQKNKTAEEALKNLNTKCSYGCKKNSQGNIYFWKGYKLHLDVSDRGYPLSAVVTGANVHDSQLAIPMEKMTEEKVQFKYSIMDSAFDAQAIKDFIRSRNRIPIIDPNKRRNTRPCRLTARQKEILKKRTSVERVNSYLKAFLLPAKLWVKGYEKVSFVLTSAVVCLGALKTLQFLVT